LSTLLGDQSTFMLISPNSSWMKTRFRLKLERESDHAFHIKYIFLVKTVTSVQQITSDLHARWLRWIRVVVLDWMKLWGRDAFWMTDEQVKNAFEDLNALQWSIICTLPVLFILIMPCRSRPSRRYSA